MNQPAPQTDTAPRRVTGASPNTIVAGDLLVIGLGDDHHDVSVKVREVQYTATGVRIGWSEIDRFGQVPNDASAGFGTDLNTPEGATFAAADNADVGPWSNGQPWRWWTCTLGGEAPHGRRRLIRSEADGEPVFRAAHRFDAHTEVTVAPPGAGRVERGEHPSIGLIVTPDGSWTVAYHPPNWEQPTVLARGHIDNPVPLYAAPTA